MRRRTCLVALWPLVACLEPAPQPRPIDGPRIVAVIADPAEAPPGSTVRYAALVASPEDVTVAPRWSFCATPRPLTENGAVSEACARAVELEPVLEGLTIEATLPRDACARFGPETSAGLRPSDPDATGGYYQPLRLTLEGETSVFRQRIRCALPDAPLARVQEFEARYRDNRHPAIEQLSLRVQGAARDFGALPPSASVALELALAPDARERYARFDHRSGRVVLEQERLSATWYASAGRLEHGSQTLATLGATNLWHSPAHAQAVRLWVVVRDDRGGVAAQTFDLTVSD